MMQDETVSVYETPETQCIVFRGAMVLKLEMNWIVGGAIPPKTLKDVIYVSLSSLLYFLLTTTTIVPWRAAIEINSTNSNSLNVID